MQSRFFEVLWQVAVTASGRVIFSLWINNCVHFASDMLVIVKADLAESAGFEV